MDDGDDVVVTEVTEEEVREQIKEIETHFPEIAAIKASDFCCRSHALQDIKQKHGVKLAALWQQLDTARWFLGE